ncbi:MAG: DUF5671 domain-containing protein [bacterium]
MQSKTTAKDFFLYLGIVIGLYMSSVSFLVLVFQIINKLFPLAGDYTEYIDSAIRSSIAILIIFFPTFVYLLFIANKDLKINPEKKDMWIKKWMLFLSFFITGLTMVADFSVLVYRLLGAEDLTLRFFLKIFFVFAVAITIFKFILKDLKRTSFDEIPKWIKISVEIVSVIILSTVIYGVTIIDSPSSRRAEKIDEQKVSDLGIIQDQIVYTYWTNKGTVPASLDILNDPISNFYLPVDTETKQNYEYRMISKNSFELCANFKNVTNKLDTVSVDPYDVTPRNFEHGIGRTCWTRIIDEELYKTTIEKMSERD